MVLWPFHQLHVCCLDLLQQVNVLPELRGPELDTKLRMCLHKCLAEGNNYCPGPAATGLLAQLGT